jgi:hypothetical protein
VVVAVTAPAAVATVSLPESGLVSLRNSVVVTPDYTAMLAALREQDEERAFYNERLQAGQVRPLFNDDMFDTKRVFTAQDQRVFRSQPAPTTPAQQQQQAEFSAFQFQR